MSIVSETGEEKKMSEIEPESYQKRPWMVESGAGTGSGEDLGAGECN